MHKPIALATSAALLIAGCQSKSPTWQKVMATPRATGDAEARDRAYAAELHRTLGKTPHRVVTFEFDYTSRFHGPSTARRTAVVYWDKTRPKHPWWIMEEAMDRPVWLPNVPLERQIDFHARRPARVVEVLDYTVATGKRVAELESARRPVAISKIERVTREEPAEPEPSATTPIPRKQKSATQEVRERDTVPKRKRSWWPFAKREETRREEAARPEAVSRLQPAENAKVRERDRERIEEKAAAKMAAEAERAEKLRVEKKAASKKAEEQKPAVAKNAAADRPADGKPAIKAKAKDAAAKPKEQAVEKKRAPEEKKKETTAAPDENAASNEKDKKPEPATEPKKKRSLFHREETPAKEPAAASKPNSAGAPRRNWFQRVFGSLNPARWFRRAA